MDIKGFFEDYTKFLKKNADASRAVQEKRYLYSDLKHYGVSVGIRRSFFNKYRRKLNTLSKESILKAVKKQWNKPYFEERALALSLLELHRDKLDISDMSLIEKMMRESRGWAFLDSLIIPLMPDLLLKDRGVFRYLKKWINDDDFWVRRSALLSQLLLFRKNSGGDKKLFFDMAVSQFDETWIDKKYENLEERKRAKFFVRKAIGWVMREMSIKDPESVFYFLKKYKNAMSGLSFREGSRRLDKKYQKQL